MSYHDALGDDPIRVGEVLGDAKVYSKKSGPLFEATRNMATVSHEGETNTATYVGGGRTDADTDFDATLTAPLDDGLGTFDAVSVTKEGHLMVFDNACVSGPGVGTGSFNTKKHIDETPTDIPAGKGIITWSKAHINRQTTQLWSNRDGKEWSPLPCMLG